MVEWQVAPLSPQSPLGQAQEVSYARMPLQAQMRTPLSEDRVATGLERYLEETGNLASPMVSNGFEGSTSVVPILDMNIGNSFLPSPPRPLLPRLRELQDSPVGLND